MTTKIEITITENDNVYFIYLYKERTLLHKFEIGKIRKNPTEVRFMNRVCTLLGESVTGLVKSLLKGD